MVFWKGWSWEVQSGAIDALEALIRKLALAPWPQDLGEIPFRGTVVQWSCCQNVRVGTVQSQVAPPEAQGFAGIDWGFPGVRASSVECGLQHEAEWAGFSQACSGTRDCNIYNSSSGATLLHVGTSPDPLDQKPYWMS